METTLSAEYADYRERYLEWLQQLVTADEFERASMDSADLFAWLQALQLHPDSMTDEDIAAYQAYAERRAVRKDA